MAHGDIDLLEGNRPAAQAPTDTRRSGNDRVESAMCAVFMAALACGLTRFEAAEMVAATVVVGVAAALAPDRTGELVDETQRRTADLVVAVRLRNERRAA